MIKALTQDQEAVAAAIAENARIIERLRLQNEALKRLLPRVRQKTQGWIRNPLTGEEVSFDGKPRVKAKRRRGASGGREKPEGFAELELVK